MKFSESNWPHQVYDNVEENQKVKCVNEYLMAFVCTFWVSITSQGIRDVDY